MRNAKVPPIKPQNPQVEPELEDIVRKSLSRRKEDRFQSATDLQDALAQYSYSRGLKVISRDIAELVRQCLEDKRMQSGEGKAKTSIIDHLLQDEIVKFTSVDFEDPGAQPLSADELRPRDTSGRPAIADEGDFVDPRGWADERLSTPAVGVADIESLERRATSKDAPALNPPGAAGRKPSGPRRTVSGELRPPRTVEPLDATPGPERLASVLEPTPAPQLPPERRPGPVPGAAAGAAPAQAQPEAPPSNAGRSFLIGAVIGAILLGGAVAVVVAKRTAPTSPPNPPAQTP